MRVFFSKTMVRAWNADSPASRRIPPPGGVQFSDVGGDASVGAASRRVGGRRVREIALADVPQRIERLCAGGERRILGLVGAPGAGKSTLAADIAGRLGDRAVIVPMDGFHLANVELARLGRADRKGAYDTFDGAGFVALLARIRAGGDDDIIYAPEFRREIEEPIAGAIAVLPEHRLIITEGNYLLLDTAPWTGLRASVDEFWFVDIDPAERTRRLIARHVRFGREPAAAAAWVAHTDEPNARLIESTRVRADAVVRLPAGDGT